jgi:hypothetical protein
MPDDGSDIFRGAYSSPRMKPGCPYRSGQPRQVRGGATDHAFLRVGGTPIFFEWALTMGVVALHLVAKWWV